MSEKKDSFSDLMGAGDAGRRRRRVVPAGPALPGGPSGPAMQGTPPGDAPSRRRRRAGDDDLMKQLYG